MLKMVISGGQTGADQAGWRAAALAGIPTGGLMPRGFRTEDGPRPEFAALYGAEQDRHSDSYRTRTIRNVHAADATLLFGDPGSPGGRLARGVLDELDRPRLGVPGPLEQPDPYEVAGWVARGGFRSLNVAGNRESSAPGIGAWVEEFLGHVFALLAGDSLVEWRPDDGPLTRITRSDRRVEPLPGRPGFRWTVVGPGVRVDRFLAGIGFGTGELTSRRLEDESCLSARALMERAEEMLVGGLLAFRTIPTQFVPS